VGMLWHEFLKMWAGHGSNILPYSSVFQCACGGVDLERCGCSHGLLGSLSEVRW